MPPQPSGKAVKKAGKAQKAVRAGDKKKKKKRRKESFSIYIYKVNHFIVLLCFSLLIIFCNFRCWNKCTQTLVSHQRPCQSWILSLMTSSKESQLKHPDWLTTTRDQQSLHGRFKLLSVCCCLVNWPNTLCLKEPKPSPNTLHPSKSSTINSSSIKRPFLGPIDFCKKG